MTPSAQQKRDELADAYEPAFDASIVTHFQKGFEAGYSLAYEEAQDMIKVLEEALESLRNDYQFGNGQVYEDISKALEKLADYRGIGSDIFEDLGEL